MEAYCVKCKTKREMVDPEATFNKIGAPVTKGTCSVCGTKLYRTGRTDAHASLTPPPKVKREPKREGKLVIVESPAKAKTVQRYLGKEYNVRASVGHVRDLLRFGHPRGINEEMVNAQQARRVLGRLVGYSISPLLWKKVRSRLSAGRVQSVALRLIVEREREIDEFIPTEYWTIEGEFKQDSAKKS